MGGTLEEAFENWRKHELADTAPDLLDDLIVKDGD
jgi:hypothetical protein